MIEDMYELYKTLKNEGILFCFIGPISQSVVEGIGAALRHKMELADTTITVSQRVFSIFVEQMQNVVNYSAEKVNKDEQIDGDLRFGMIVVGQKTNGQFYIVSGNHIHKDDTERIMGLLDTLKQMDKEELKALYKEQRKLSPPEGSKGAGLGLIETARKASQPIEYTLTSSVEGRHNFLSIQAVI
ncbi:MAG: SiaB family protein kinase [Proteobacteria bacterium]|nr:SiaB family protein kinase [Pseudomonadota bacterium]